MSVVTDTVMAGAAAFNSLALILVGSCGFVRTEGRECYCVAKESTIWQIAYCDIGEWFRDLNPQKVSSAWQVSVINEYLQVFFLQYNGHIST